MNFSGYDADIRSHMHDPTPMFQDQRAKPGLAPNADDTCVGAIARVHVLCETSHRPEATAVLTGSFELSCVGSRGPTARHGVVTAPPLPSPQASTRRSAAGP